MTSKYYSFTLTPAASAKLNEVSEKSFRNFGQQLRHWFTTTKVAEDCASTKYRRGASKRVQVYLAGPFAEELYASIEKHGGNASAYVEALILAGEE